MILPVTPVGKPRMTRRDKWAQRPAVVRYHQFCDELRLLYRKDVPDEVSLRFNLPMPKSWSLKKRLEMEGKPHQQRPDIDNLIKAFLDALCEDDSYVYSIKGEKYWSLQGSLEVVEP